MLLQRTTSSRRVKGKSTEPVPGRELLNLFAARMHDECHLQKSRNGRPDRATSRADDRSPLHCRFVFRSLIPRAGLVSSIAHRTVTATLRSLGLFT